MSNGKFNKTCKKQQKIKVRRKSPKSFAAGFPQYPLGDV